MWAGHVGDALPNPALQRTCSSLTLEAGR